MGIPGRYRVYPGILSVYDAALKLRTGQTVSGFANVLLEGAWSPGVARPLQLRCLGSLLLHSLSPCEKDIEGSPAHAGLGKSTAERRSLQSTKLDKIKNLHSTDSIDTQNSSTRGRLVWVHSSQVGKSVLTNGCVTLFPMNGSILLWWTYFDGRQNHLRDVAGRTVSI